jgi:ABC-type uncharacterized transport system involved in gliding motility auxiliary subunit
MKVVSKGNIMKAGGGAAGLLALLAIILAVNTMASNLRFRKDLTEERLYSLSPGSKRVLKNMDTDVTIKFFFNSKSPQVPLFLKDYARQVEDLLREYCDVSGGRVVLETFDPEPDSDEEEWAQRYGISGQTVSPFDPPVYLGLVAVAGQTEGTIPVLDPRAEELLEYNITRLIYGVCHPDKPVVGVLSSLPVMGRQIPRMAYPMMPPEANQPPWAAFQELKRDYDLRELQPSVEEIDKDIKALILVHPKDLPEKTLYAIDQFALSGGRVIAFVDPLSLADLESQPQQNPYGMGQQSSSDLAPLFRAWGIGYEPDKVLADPRGITRVRGAGNRIEDSPVIVSARDSNMSGKDTLTARIESMIFPFAGVLKDETAAGAVFTALVSSSDSAGSVDPMTARFGGQAMRSSFKPAGTALALAARVTGKAKSAFPDGLPSETSTNSSDSASSPPNPEGHLTEGNIAVLVVADTDLLDDRFAVETLNFFGTSASRAINDNISFLAGAVEQMTGSDDLVGLRTRGKFQRPFDRVVELENKARLVWQAKEDDLQKQLDETRSQLSQLQDQKDQNQRFILSDDQQRAIANFRSQETRIKAELKDVRKSLRKDIENLGVAVKTTNIALMPLLVSIAGVSYGLARRRRR